MECVLQAVGVCSYCDELCRACRRCGKGSYCEKDHKCQFCNCTQPAIYECGECDKKIKGGFAKCYVCNTILCSMCFAQRDCECGEQHVVCDDDHVCQYNDCTVTVCHGEGVFREALGGGTYCPKHQRKVVSAMKRIKLE